MLHDGAHRRNIFKITVILRNCISVMRYTYGSRNFLSSLCVRPVSVHGDITVKVKFVVQTVGAGYGRFAVHTASH